MSKPAAAGLCLGKLVMLAACVAPEGGQGWPAKPGQATGHYAFAPGEAGGDVLRLLPSGVADSALRMGDDGCHYYQAGAQVLPLLRDGRQSCVDAGSAWVAPQELRGVLAR